MSIHPPMKQCLGPTEWRPYVRGGPLMRRNAFCFAPFPSSALIVTSRATVVPPKKNHLSLRFFPFTGFSQMLIHQQRISDWTPNLCHPELTYAWIFNEYPHFVQQDSRRFISQETGSLYIAKVERSDVGNYTCVVNNTVTGDKVLSSPTPLVLRSDGKCMLFLHALFKQQRHIFQHHSNVFSAWKEMKFSLQTWEHNKNTWWLTVIKTDYRPTAFKVML